MSHVNTDQKLQLIHTIRMQNQYNRMKCREREQLLYGTVQNDRRELYGAEASMSLPVTGETAIPVKRSGVFTGFRLRFLIAVMLLSAFIYLDKNEINIFGETTIDLFTSLTESIDLPVDLPFLNSFDL
ncbi:MAG: hypothetical protein ACI4ED_07605 [Suilimivivens sp.]